MATFRHKTIRRFIVGRFEFNDFEMVLTKEEDIAEFRAIVADLPPYESNPIVEINEEARATLETRLVETKPVVRGAMSAMDILTAKDQNQAKEQTGEPAPGATTRATSAAMNLGVKLAPLPK